MLGTLLLCHCLYGECMLAHCFSWLIEIIISCYKMQQFLWKPSSAFLYVTESRQFSTPVVPRFNIVPAEGVNYLSSALYRQSVLFSVVQIFVHYGLCSLYIYLTSFGSQIRSQCFIKNRNQHTYTCRCSSYAGSFIYLLALFVCLFYVLHRTSKVIWCLPPVEHKSVLVRK